MSSRHNINKSKGFTLLEVLIAVAIFAVISGIAYSGLSSVLTASHKTQAVNRSLQELQLAMSLMHQDLTQIVDRSVSDEFGDTQPAVKSGGSFEKIIRFTRRGWRNPAQRTRSTLQRVAYRIDENTLIREYWQHLDRAPNPKIVSLPLLEKVKELSFRYYDQSNNWQQQWPPLSQAQDKPVPLPRAIEMKLDTEQWGEITRLFVVGQ